MNEDIELTGVVTKLDFVNPHAWLNFNVTAANGTTSEYRCEMRIGHWDGDVLVVDTVGFLPGTLMGTTPHSGALHIVERFSLDAATMALKREYTAEDAAYLTESIARSDTVLPSGVPYGVETCEDLAPTGASAAPR